MAILYVLSGVSQPLLINVAKDAGLTDLRCQLHMLFYYLGPAAVALGFCRPASRCTPSGSPPSAALLRKGGAIQCLDIFAQMLNYTGSTLAGPTIFAIVYSSVTVWTAVQSRLLLSRRMVAAQWAGVLLVFGGLGITAAGSRDLGPDVFRGTLCVTVGSALHALMYVLSEALMTVGEERLTVPATCAVQGTVASSLLLAWQLLYTLPRWDETVGGDLEKAGTAASQALGILAALALSNFVHAYSFFHTLRHFPNGATSAGIMKGLQAVLVFLCTSLLFCGKSGGEEMCFSGIKFLSLVTVVSGVSVYGWASDWARVDLHAADKKYAIVRDGEEN